MDEKLAPLDSLIVIEFDADSTTSQDDAVDLDWQQYSRDAAAAAAIEDADNGGVAATDDEEQIVHSVDNLPNLAVPEDAAADLPRQEYSCDAADHGEVSATDDAEQIVHSADNLAAAEDGAADFDRQEYIPEDTDHGCKEYTAGIAATVDSDDNLPNLVDAVEKCDISWYWEEYKGDSHDEGEWQTVTCTKRRMKNNNKSNNGNGTNSVTHETDYTVAVANNSFSSLLADNGKVGESKKKRRNRKKTKKKKKPMVEEEAEKKMDGQDDLPAMLPHSRRLPKSGIGCGGILVIIIVLAVWQWLLYSCRILLGVSRF